MDFEVATMTPWAVEKWNGFDTKSSLSPMKHTWSFLWILQMKSSNFSYGTLKLLNGVCILTKALVFCLTSYFWQAYVKLGRIRIKHTCIAHIAKSNNGSMEKHVIPLDQDVHVCGNMVIMITP
jgi:hypothetical protein